jgi:hypothetical protein
MKIKGGSSVELKLTERIYKLPLADNIKPMSQDMIPSIHYGAHSTHVIKPFTL